VTNERVAKCQFFFTKQNLQTKFHPKESAQIATIFVLLANKTNQKADFGGEMLTNLSIKASFYMEIMQKLCNSFQKGLILLNHMCSQTFYPNLQKK
jgi:hypothetical protein